MQVNLYNLQEVLKTSDEMREFNDAKSTVEHDLTLQILFGEFDKFAQVDTTYLSPDAASELLQKLSQIKQDVFACESYMKLRNAEKRVNALRTQIAQEIFHAISIEIPIDGVKVKVKGGCKCG